MFLLRGPYPNSVVTSILPSPEFGDEVSLVADVTVKRATDSCTRTYVKNKQGNKLLTFDWRLTRDKAIELRSFLDLYHSQVLQIVDHRDRVWVVHLVVDGTDFTTVGRWFSKTFSGLEGVRQEEVNIQLQFRTIN